MKKFVKVQAIFDCDGNILPESIIWDNGQVYTIEHVTDIRYTCSAGADDTELRFTCYIKGKERYLYYFGSRWFVDAKSSRQKKPGA